MFHTNTQSDWSQVATPAPVLRSISRPPREVQKKISVLAIEDDRSIHSLYRCALSKERFTLFSRFDGTSGLDAAIALKPDLILLDLSLPDISGVFICKYLKSDARTMNIPVIFVTGAVAMDDMLSEIDLDASDFMLKPFADEDLVARIEMLVEQQTQSQGKPLTMNQTAGPTYWNSFEELPKHHSARHYRIELNWKDMSQVIDDYRHHLNQMRRAIVDQPSAG